MLKYLKKKESTFKIQSASTYSLGILIIIGFSCTSKPDQNPVLQDRLRIESTDTGQYFLVQDLDSLLKVYSGAQEKDFTMSKVPTASGVKYQSEDGFFLWMKGQEFMWGKGDSVITTGNFPIDTPRQPKEFYGDYVSDGYSQKDEGYDWVAVSIIPFRQHWVRISVRSRTDRKKATCTFDGLAVLQDDNTLAVHDDNFSILFQFNGDSLTIGADSQEHEDRLYFFCSGGASLSGSYTRINTPLDSKQIDKVQFIKTLTWNDLFFFIRVEDNTLTLTPSGLEIDNRPVTHTIDGTVYNAEVGDLNIDGHPEVLVYYDSNGDISYGSVIGYSVNNGKSISEAYLPPIQESPELLEGYQGDDEFAIVENTLVRRFPIFESNDPGSDPTGKMRQIQYKLVDGEAMRRFQVDKVVEY